MNTMFGLDDCARSGWPKPTVAKAAEPIPAVNCRRVRVSRRRVMLPSGDMILLRTQGIKPNSAGIGIYLSQMRHERRFTDVASTSVYHPIADIETLVAA